MHYSSSLSITWSVRLRLLIDELEEPLLTLLTSFASSSSLQVVGDVDKKTLGDGVMLGTSLRLLCDAP